MIVSEGIIAALCHLLFFGGSGYEPASLQGASHSTLTDRVGIFLRCTGQRALDVSDGQRAAMLSAADLPGAR